MLETCRKKERVFTNTKCFYDGSRAFESVVGGMSGCFEGSSGHRQECGTLSYLFSAYI